MAIVWFVVILILNCLGEKRVGFFAGSFTHPSSKRPDDGQGVEVVTDKPELQGTTTVVDSAIVNKFNRRVMTVRIMFVCCGIAVIVSGKKTYYYSITFLTTLFN